MKKGVAYKLKFPNGKIYIGITRESVEKRIKRHINYAKNGKKFALSCAIRKYGENSFSYEIVGEGTWEYLKKLEIQLIKENNSFGNNGYNMTSGEEGSLGVALKESTKNKISNSLSGRHLSNEHRKNIGIAQKSKSISNETKEKMRIAAIKRHRDSPISDEQKQKTRESLIGKKHSKERIEKRVLTRKINGNY
jgi:group I intron endonuclease